MNVGSMSESRLYYIRHISSPTAADLSVTISPDHLSMSGLSLPLYNVSSPSPHLVRTHTHIPRYFIKVISTHLYCQQGSSVTLELLSH